ncbi:radical SAM/SPASM domain-containing protein [Mycobacterium innocens]|uniref:radical SAM/SPASM domain-containing protein n=1 Tax=Mycobacterium innocens TaxID=2341083 RepID=UPI00142D255A|nr:MULTISPECIES: radical SAM protein [Mycobacterium]
MILEVPAQLRNVMHPAVAGARPDTAVAEWLQARDLLTYSPRVSWAEAAPNLPQVTDVSLDMSGACNMGCVYCFENDIGARIGRMDDDTAMAALDFAFAQAVGAPRLSLHFGSGEPLMRFDLLRRIVARALQHSAQSGQEIAFELTTNATLVTRDIASFLRDHPFNVRVSCDGPAAVHNAHRPMRNGRPSHHNVMAGLGLLLDYLPERVTVNSVLTDGTRLRGVWIWAKMLGLRHFHVIKVGAYSGQDFTLDPAELPDFRADLTEICADMFADLEAGRTPIDYQPITKIVRRLMIPQPITRFCGVAGSYLGVAANGKVYPCFRHLGLPRYELGDIRSGLDDNKRREFISHEAADVDNRPVCRDCWARYLCGGGCYADSTVYGPDAAEPQKQHCPFWRAEIEQSIRFYRRLIAADPTYCLRLFGDNPDDILEAVGTASFLKRQNCF